MPEMNPPALDQMLAWGTSGGNVVKVLFQAADDGMSLVWSWFGPDYPLPRHSHNADCLYYVVAGEARMGNRVIAAGAGFFVPAGAPYAYTAGRRRSDPRVPQRESIRHADHRRARPLGPDTAGRRREARIVDGGSRTDVINVRSFSIGRFP